MALSQIIQTTDGFKITMRDYFAVYAMQALVTKGVIRPEATAYEIADRMLEKRKEST